LGQGNSYVHLLQVLFYSVIVSGLLETTILSVMIDLSQNKIMLADSDSGSSLCLCP
jgi:hypothetical protein